MKIINFEGLCPRCKVNISYKASLQGGTHIVQCYCERCRNEIMGE